MPERCEEYTDDMLTSEELAAKIGAVNKVLAEAVAAIDETQGPGRGQAVVAGILPPAGAHAWLAAVEVSAGGMLEAEEVWAALHPFPPDQRHEMLNLAFVELLEGVLSHPALD
jgi:hypothetical protein